MLMQTHLTKSCDLHEHDKYQLSFVLFVEIVLLSCSSPATCLAMLKPTQSFCHAAVTLLKCEMVRLRTIVNYIPADAKSVETTGY